MNTARATFLPILVTVVALSGCAATKSKFTPRTVPDLGAFADQTIALMQGPDTAIYRDESLLIRPYLTTEVGDRAVELVDRIFGLMAAVTEYSVGIADLSNVEAEEAELIPRYASLLQSLEEDAVTRLDITRAQFDQTVATVRSQEKFLDALRAAQPIINSLGRYAQNLMTEYEDLIDNEARRIDTVIEEEYAPLMVYTEMLEDRRVTVLVELESVYENEAAGELRLSNTEANLIERLENVERLFAEITPRHELYRATHRELDTLHVQLLRGAANVRLVFLLWVRAHERMASGIKDDAEWFDFTDVGTAAFRLLRKII